MDEEACSRTLVLSPSAFDVNAALHAVEQACAANCSKFDIGDLLAGNGRLQAVASDACLIQTGIAVNYAEPAIGCVSKRLHYGSARAHGASIDVEFDTEHALIRMPFGLQCDLAGRAVIPSPEGSISSIVRIP